MVTPSAASPQPGSHKGVRPRDFRESDPFMRAWPQAGPLKELNPVLAVQGHNRLLPVGQPADTETVTAFLAQAVLRPHLFDTDIEQFLNRGLDLILGRPEIYLESVGIVVFVGRLVGALFGNQRLDNDLVRFELGAYALMPDVKIIAPWREWDLLSREKLLRYAEEHGIPVDFKKKRGKSCVVFWTCCWCWG